jgi:hypothetical protein
MIDEKRFVGITDTRTALGAVLSHDGVPVDLQGLTVSFKATLADVGTSVVAEATTNVSVEPEQSVTIDTDTGKVKGYALGLESGDVIRFTASTMATGLTAGVMYKVGPCFADGFYIQTMEGKKVSPTTTGTAMKVVQVGRVAYSWQAADVASARTLDCVFRVVDGSDKDTFPVSRRLLVEVTA